MAYEVTATRRRPKTFDELAGQDFVVSTLRRSIESGRIAHAYLFSGPRGCGKTSAARILARSLNCEKGPTVTPCGVCSACVEIAKGSSMDVIEIDGASNTSVNDVRQIKDEVLFPPNSSRYKIYIIDEVHMLSNSAFNALLKTIEEPPPYVIFVFATTELHKVPATIKSRCQQFNFRLIPVDTIKGILADACAELGIEADDESLFWIAKESTGSLRDAYTLFDQVAAFSDGVLSAEKIREKLGLVGLDAVNALVESCARGKAADALAAVDAVLQSGVSAEQFTVDLADYFRSLLLLKSGVTKEALLGYAPERYSSLVLETFSPVQLERALSLLLGLHRNLRFSLNPRYELETVVSRLCWLPGWVSSAELRAAIDGVRGLLLNPPEPAPGGARPLPDAVPSPGTTDGSSAVPAPAAAATPAPRPGAAPSAAREVPGGSAGAAGLPGETTPSSGASDAAPGLAESFRQFIAQRERGGGNVFPGSPSGDVPRAQAPAAEADVVPAGSVAPPAPTPSILREAPDGESYEDEYGDGGEEDDSTSAEDLWAEAVPGPGQSKPTGDAAVGVPGGPAPGLPGSSEASAAPTDPAALRTAAIEALRKERGILASGLEKTLAWEISSSRIVIPAPDRLSAELLRKDAAIIAEVLRQGTGPSANVEIVERSSAVASEGAGSVAPQLEVVRKLFRGTIVRNVGA